MPQSSALRQSETAGFPAGSPAASPKPERLWYVDAFRGFVIALMALDHVRSFFHDQAIVFDPTDLRQTTTAIFITRWVTHLCAPAFVFLAGAAANMSMRRGRSPDALAGFLRSRGLWLIVVEFTLVKLGWTFNLDYHLTVGQVIWATGWGMIFLSFLIRLPASTVLRLGMGAMALHGLLVMVPSSATGPLWPVWDLLFTGNKIEWAEGFSFSSKYPIFPWSALMAVGYGAGPLFGEDRTQRRRLLVFAGVASLAAFGAMRWVEMGGMAAWEGGLSTLLWFVDVEKYPPSMTFFLATIGVSLLILAVIDRKSGRAPTPLIVFGRVPFFFYVVHIPFIHALAILAEFVGRPGRPQFPMENWRYSLPFVYLIWISVLILMYPFCRWFSDLKKRRSDRWLSYL